MADAMTPQAPSPMLTTLAIQNYRSLRDLIVPLAPLNLVTGPNGCGKSNLYRALRLLAETAQGGVVAALAREGGIQSTLWAGPESLSPAMRRGDHPVEPDHRHKPVRLSLGFTGEDFGYAISLGLPGGKHTAFALDPHIKTETLWAGPAPRPATTLLTRENALVRNREETESGAGARSEARAGGWAVIHDRMSPFESVLGVLADPRRTPEVAQLRETLRTWRFYDHFRTDGEAPARQARLGTHTPVLSHDGSDLAAALQTLREIGDGEALDEAVDDAFPGCRVDIESHGGRFEVVLSQPGLLRPLKAVELSDGTLRYLLWAAALLSPRPPALLVLNEPETSLHPDLLPSLGRLILQAARQTQVIVVSHASRLIQTLERAECNTLVLEKELGQTTLAGQNSLDLPPWRWP